MRGDHCGIKRWHKSQKAIKSRSLCRPQGQKEIRRKIIVYGGKSLHFTQPSDIFILTTRGRQRGPFLMQLKVKGSRFLQWSSDCIYVTGTRSEKLKERKKNTRKGLMRERRWKNKRRNRSGTERGRWHEVMWNFLKGQLSAEFTSQEERWAKRRKDKQKKKNWLSFDGWMSPTVSELFTITIIFPCITVFVIIFRSLILCF